MRAVVLSEFGPPSVLSTHEVDEPLPKPGQALIEVELVNVTFVETQIRAGRAPNPAMAPKLPTIPGNGVGGVVIAVGDETDSGLVGRRVVSSTGGSGAYAERALAAVEQLIAVPDRLELASAVALLADGRTALALMRSADVHEGETVLIEAAGGGVGTLLVQLAKRAGARVIAAAGAPRKLALARELGADAVVDYSNDGWAAEDASERAGVDVVFDGVGGAIGRTAFELLRRGGRHVAFGMASGSFTLIAADDADARGVRLLRGSAAAPEELRALAHAALEQGAAGDLRAVVGQRFALEDAAGAHRAIEARETLGKTLLVVDRAAGRAQGTR